MDGARTAEQRFACDEGDLEPGESMTLSTEQTGGVAIALFRTEGGEFFATADSCTHEEFSLGEDSDLEGTEVECPLHLARFDLRTGEALCFPATVALQTFEVRVEDGKVYVLA